MLSIWLLLAPKPQKWKDFDILNLELCSENFCGPYFRFYEVEPDFFFKTQGEIHQKTHIFLINMPSGHLTYLKNMKNG